MAFGILALMVASLFAVAPVAAADPTANSGSTGTRKRSFGSQNIARKRSCANAVTRSRL